VTDWTSLFAVYREVVIRDDEILQGMLLPELHPRDPRVETALAGWEGTHFLHHTPYGFELTLVRRRGTARPERWWLHLLLGLATLLTTTIAGAYFVGRDPLTVAYFPLGGWGMPLPVHLSLPNLLPGLAFSVPLLVILFGHEMGHYLTARWHRMDVSPPYFIPSPNWVNVIGTFGAFIRLRSPVINKVMLLDVGAAGPVMSFLLALPMLAYGLWRSTPLGPTSLQPLGRYVVLLGAQPIWLGDSLLVHLLAAAFGPADAGTGVILLSPLAFAGWLGLFVTALNLFPLSQLDGGHILYSLVGRWQRQVGLGFLVLLIGLGRYWWGWWFWAAVILLIGRGTIRHPAVFDSVLPVGRRRALLGWACVVIFVLTFVAIPLQG
jgi:membrane-associated protease RseP (regulator of RpoE activity)